MENEGNIKRYTAAELRAMRARGEDQTDWEAVKAKNEEDLARDTASDPAWDGIPEDWYKDAVLVMPGRKRLVSLRIDDDVLEWFKAQGPGYQTRLNAVLRSFMVQAKASKD